MTDWRHIIGTTRSDRAYLIESDADRKARFRVTYTDRETGKTITKCIDMEAALERRETRSNA